MTTFKLIQGSYTNVTNSLGNDASEKKYWVGTLEHNNKDVALTQIDKDLHRQCFFGFDYQVNDWLNAWSLKEISDNTTYGYTQGDMTGESFSKMLFVYYLNSRRKKADMEEIINDAHSIKPLSFGYYDDNGTPCGFSITYYLHEPHLDYWSAAIIKNTTGTLDQRTVFLGGCSDIFTTPDDTDNNNHDAGPALLSNLNSKKISALLAPVFKKDGTINLRVLNQLQDIMNDISTIKKSAMNENQAKLLPLDELINKMIAKEQAHLIKLSEIASKNIPYWVIGAVALLAAGFIASVFLAPVGVVIAVGAVAALGSIGLYIRQKNQWTSEAAELEQQAAYVDQLEEALVEMQKPSKDIGSVDNSTLDVPRDVGVVEMKCQQPLEEDELNESRHSVSSDVTINTGLQKKNTSMVSSNVPTENNSDLKKNHAKPKTISVDEVILENLNQPTDEDWNDIINPETNGNDDFYFLNDVSSNEEKDDESQTNSSRSSTPRN